MAWRFRPRSRWAACSKMLVSVLRLICASELPEADQSLKTKKESTSVNDDKESAPELQGRVSGQIFREGSLVKLPGGHLGVSRARSFHRPPTSTATACIQWQP